MDNLRSISRYASQAAAALPDGKVQRAMRASAARARDTVASRKSLKLQRFESAARAIADPCMEKLRLRSDLGRLAGNVPGLPKEVMQRAMDALKGGATPSAASERVAEFAKTRLGALKHRVDEIVEDAGAHTGRWLRDCEVPATVRRDDWEAARNAMIGKELREAAELEVCAAPDDKRRRHMLLQPVLNRAHDAVEESARRYAPARAGLAPWLNEAGYSSLDINQALSGFDLELARSGDLEEAEIAGRARAVVWAGWRTAESQPRFQRKLEKAHQLFDSVIDAAKRALRNLQEPWRAHDVLEETVEKALRDALV